jgi:hypothetical protein
MNSYFFKITDEEKTNILNKHKELYNGYLSVQAKVKPTRLSTYDDISDKKGFILTNADLVKESTGGMCSECGGKMYEGECSECGSMNENLDIKDIDTENKMDFIEMDDDMIEMYEMYDMDEMDEMDYDMIEMDEMDDEEPIYEFEYDEYGEMSSMTESFVREAKKLILSESRKIKSAKKLNENYKKDAVVNDKLAEIKNFMHRIAKY